MCLTQDEQQRIQTHVRETFGGAPLAAPAAPLAGYSGSFAAAANENDPGRAPPLTAGEVLVCAYTEVMNSSVAAEVEEAFFALTGKVIRDAVYWIGSRVHHLAGYQQLQSWAEYSTEGYIGEIGTLSAMLWCTLLRGNCGCHESWCHLGLDPSVAAQRCAAEHDLIRWNGNQRLRDFLECRWFTAGSVCRTQAKGNSAGQQLPPGNVGQDGVAHRFESGPGSALATESVATERLATMTTVEPVVTWPTSISHPTGCGCRRSAVPGPAVSACKT